jgi:hypothetical protein
MSKTPNNIDNDTTKTEKHNLNLGPFTIVSNMIQEMKNNVPFPVDKSTATITNGSNAITFFRNAITFFTANVLFKSTKFDVESKGDITFKSEGNLLGEVTGNLLLNIGKTNAETVKAQQELTKIADKALKEQKDKIKSTKGTLVACPDCLQQYLTNRKAGFIIRAKLLIKNLGIKLPYMSNPIDTFINIMADGYSQVLSRVDTKSLRGGTCGSKGCKDGMIESSSNKLEEGNKAAQKVLEENAEKILKLEDKIGKSDSVISFAGDTVFTFGPPTSNKESSYVKTGTRKPESGSRSQKDPKTGQVIINNGEGNIEEVVYVPPIPTKGFLNINVNSKFLLKTGNHGMDILSSGHAHIACGSVLLAATEGELIITSSNQTTIKGKSIRIDADDRSGSGGLTIKSKHTKVQGGLNVDGNFTAKGGMTCDGDLCVSHIVGRSMKLTTGESSSSKSVSNGANFLGKCQAMDIADNILQDLQCKINIDWILQTQNIFKTVLETFNTSINATMVEFPEPTGWYVGYCWNAAGPGVSWGSIWNYKHNHSQTPSPHQHEHEHIKAHLLRTPEDWGGSRISPSNIPTPATETGMGFTPGPRGLGGACGGGAGFNVFDDPNSRASKARRQRNRRFGIDSDDAYGIYDFVNVTPLSGNFGYDKDGEIIPKDLVNLSLGFDCPVDTIISDDNTTDTDGNKKDC